MQSHGLAEDRGLCETKRDSGALFEQAEGNDDESLLFRLPEEERTGPRTKDMVKAIYSMRLGVACFASTAPLYAGSRHVEPDTVQDKGDKVDKEFYSAKERLAAIHAATIYVPMGRVRPVQIVVGA